MRILTSRTFLALSVVMACGVLALAGSPLPLEHFAEFPLGPDHFQAGLGAASFFVIGDIADVKKLVEDMHKSWHDFQQKNDERLKAIESKGYAPADLVDQVNKLNADITETQKKLKEEQENMDRLEARLNRPGGGSGGGLSKEQEEHKSAFRDFLRTGRDSGLRDAERKALRSTSDVDGGYLVERELDGMIDRVAGTIQGFRGIANVRVVGSKVYAKRVKTSGLSGRWVGETEAGGESTNPKFAEIEIPVHKIEVEPWSTNDVLEDADYDLESDLADEAGIAFAETEGAAFISGTGVKKPRGILAYDIVANASYEWGKIGYIASGASGAFASSNPADKLIDLQHALKQQYRNGAVWLTNDATLAKIRQIKDGSGNFYLWQPDPSAGFNGLILGAPVAIDDNMPALASNSYSLAFGNFRRGYTITDRRGTVLIRDNLTTKGYTKWNLTRRVGGGVTHFEAIKLMKFASS